MPPRGVVPLEPDTPLKVGEWYRTPQSDKSHKLSGDGETALCGRPLKVDPEVWLAFAADMFRIYSAQIEAWWIAPENRKTGNCTECKAGKKAHLFAPPPAPPRVAPSTGEPPTYSMYSRMKFLRHVELIARLLDAEVVDDASRSAA